MFAEFPLHLCAIPPFKSYHEVQFHIVLEGDHTTQAFPYKITCLCADDNTMLFFMKFVDDDMMVM